MGDTTMSKYFIDMCAFIEYCLQFHCPQHGVVFSTIDFTLFRHKLYTAVVTITIVS